MFAVCSLGDVDGDRVPDLAITATGRVIVVSIAESRAILAIDPPGFVAPRKVVLARLGDLDGDGRSEIAAAWLRGRKNWTSLRVHSTKDGRELWSKDDDEHDLEVLVGAGDLDEDGTPDLLAGSPRAAQFAGTVRALSGKDGRLIHEAAGEFAESQFGTAIAPMGDTDGDGVPDFAVGAPGRDPRTGVRCGAVHLVSGASGKRIRILSGESWIPGDAGFGAVVVSGGDFDRDGVPDLVLGQRQGRWGSPSVARVLVLSGSSGASLLELVESGPFFTGLEGYGSTLEIVGDGTGDGIPELLVGCPDRHLGIRPGELGDVEMAGGVELVDGRTGEALRVWVGGMQGRRLGRWIIGAGDLAYVGAGNRIDLVSWKTGIFLESLDVITLERALCR